MLRKKEMNKKAQAMQNQTLYLLIAVAILAIVGFFVWNFYQGADETSEYVPKDLELAVQACKNYALLDSSISFCEYREMELAEGGKVYANCNYVYEIAEGRIEEDLGFQKKENVCLQNATSFCMEKAVANFGSFRGDRVDIANKNGNDVEKCSELLKESELKKSYCSGNKNIAKVVYYLDADNKKTKGNCTDGSLVKTTDW